MKFKKCKFKIILTDQKSKAKCKQRRKNAGFFASISQTIVNIGL